MKRKAVEWKDVGAKERLIVLDVLHQEACVWMPSEFRHEWDKDVARTRHAAYRAAIAVLRAAGKKTRRRK